MEARQAFTDLAVKSFAPGEPLAPGALAQVQDGAETLWYFLGPSAGGTEVEMDGQAVLVITAHSPLGQRLLGKRAGEALPGGMRVVAVF